MKQMIQWVLALVCWTVNTWAVEPLEDEDEAAWFAGVEAVRLNGGFTPKTIRSLLEEYDSTLVREYFRQFGPRDIGTNMKEAISDMEWKLIGLAMYGDKSDLGEMKSLAFALSSCPADEYRRFIQETALPALLAREGNSVEIAEAMDALTRGPLWMQEDALLLSGGAAARDKLVEFARDSKIGFDNRCSVLSALNILDDPRRLAVMLSPDFVDQARQHQFSPDDKTFLELVVIYTRKADLMNLKTVAALRELVKQGFKLPPREVKKKTVRGGIDWSKYWKKTSSTSSKAAHASVPKRIEQSKPEKSTAVAAPASKPPASNAGKLIAAGAAIVGLLAVLIWFLRRK